MSRSRNLGRVTRYRWFESGFLQRGVSCEPAFRKRAARSGCASKGVRGKSPQPLPQRAPIKPKSPGLWRCRRCDRRHSPTKLAGPRSLAGRGSCAYDRTLAAVRVLQCENISLSPRSLPSLLDPGRGRRQRQSRKRVRSWPYSGSALSRLPAEEQKERQHGENTDNQEQHRAADRPQLRNINASSRPNVGQCPDPRTDIHGSAGWNDFRYGTCDAQLFEKAAARQSVRRTAVLVSFGIFVPPVEERPQRPNLLLSTAKVIFKVPLPPLQDQDAQHLPSSTERGGNLFGPSQGPWLPFGTRGLVWRRPRHAKITRLHHTVAGDHRSPSKRSSQQSPAITGRP
jgi:hypothetical protein